MNSRKTLFSYLDDVKAGPEQVDALPVLDRVRDLAVKVERRLGGRRLEGAWVALSQAPWVEAKAEAASLPSGVGSIGRGPDLEWSVRGLLVKPAPQVNLLSMVGAPTNPGLAMTVSEEGRRDDLGGVLQVLVPLAFKPLGPAAANSPFIALSASRTHIVPPLADFLVTLLSEQPVAAPGSFSLFRGPSVPLSPLVQHPATERLRVDERLRSRHRLLDQILGRSLAEAAIWPLGRVLDSVDPAGRLCSPLRERSHPCSLLPFLCVRFDLQRLESVAPNAGALLRATLGVQPHPGSPSSARRCLRRGEKVDPLVWLRSFLRWSEDRLRAAPPPVRMERLRFGGERRDALFSERALRALCMLPTDDDIPPKRPMPVTPSRVFRVLWDGLRVPLGIQPEVNATQAGLGGLPALVADMDPGLGPTST